jgi:DNA-binding protein HU-beta
MTKAQLIDRVQRKLPPSAGISKKEATEIVDLAFREIVGSILVDKRFSYPGFGTFHIRARSARKGRNPRTGEAIEIGAAKSVGFRPAPRLKNGL